MNIEATDRGGLPLPATFGHGSGAARASEPWSAWRTEMRLLERWAPTVLAGRHVLEVGAGTGHWTRFIAPHTSSLLATDAQEHRLATARSRVSSRKARFAVADDLHLPAHLGRFDGAFAGFRLSQVPPERLGDFFTSLHARLEPSAKVLLLDYRMVPLARRALWKSDDSHEVEGLQAPMTGSRVMERLLRQRPVGDDLLQRLAGVVSRPVLHQWAFFWALCYEMAPAGA